MMKPTTDGSTPAPSAKLTSQQIKRQVHRRLLESMDLVQARRMSRDLLSEECSRRIDALLNEQRHPLTAPEKQQLLREVMDEVFGLGPLETILRDPSISDILINGPDQIYVERHGRLSPIESTFHDDKHLLQVIQRIASSIGRRIDESSPMLDARLSDGSRVNAIIPPLALDGPAMSIRRFGAVPITVEKLVALGAMVQPMADFLHACVKAKRNILIAGGTGSGKTTLLNVLSRWIPDGERVVTIEDAAELQLQRDHVVRLETRPPNIEGRGEVAQRELLRNTLRMRPDRIIVGEVRGAEALDMLQAMNTGHEGSMTTIHANSSRDALSRVENMVTMAVNYPTHVVRTQIASALDIVVHLSRLTGGRRKLLAVSEVTGIEGETVCLQDIFAFRQRGIDAEGHALGHFEATGVRPQMMSHIEAEGIDLPGDLFQRRIVPMAEGAA